MRSTPQLAPRAAFTAQDIAILGPLRRGEADSRAGLSRVTGLSPTTVAARVEALLREGHIREQGPGSSQGGRRPRTLAVRGDAGVVGCVDLGLDRVSVGVVDLAGRLLTARTTPLDIGDGPEAVTDRIRDELEHALAAEGVPPLAGIAIAVPGPVSRDQRLIAPSRMPGWHGAELDALMRERFAVPVLVGNDANLMALGRHALDGADLEDEIFLKAGLGVGCGVIASGVLHTGRSGSAGDVSHVPVPGAEDVPCSCGRSGCLDAVASGGALVESMRAAGSSARSIDDVIDLARDGDAAASRQLREAGRMTGHVLATIVNFFAPERLVIGGLLARSSEYVSGIRSTLYAECLPMATEHLDIVTDDADAQVSLLGAGRALLDELFSATR